MFNTYFSWLFWLKVKPYSQIWGKGILVMYTRAANVNDAGTEGSKRLGEKKITKSKWRPNIQEWSDVQCIVGHIFLCTGQWRLVVVALLFILQDTIVRRLLYYIYIMKYAVHMVRAKSVYSIFYKLYIAFVTGTLSMKDFFFVS